MKKIKSGLTRLAEGILVIGMLMMAVPVIWGMQCYTVLSESMEPKIPKGAVIYVKRVPFAQIKTGDVITYQMGPESVTVTHRVVNIDKDKRVLFTKGDRNQIQDACPVQEKKIQGIVIGCIPIVGYGILFVKDRYRIVILIILLGIAIRSCLLIKRRGEWKGKCKRRAERNG